MFTLVWAAMESTLIWPPTSPPPWVVILTAPVVVVILPPTVMLPPLWLPALALRTALELLTVMPPAWLPWATMATLSRACMPATLMPPLPTAEILTPPAAAEIKAVAWMPALRPVSLILTLPVTAVTLPLTVMFPAFAPLALMFTLLCAVTAATLMLPP